jgi:hypothetical protein
MRKHYLALAAGTALIAGLATAHAQRSQDSPGAQPPAASSPAEPRGSGPSGAARSQREDRGSPRGAAERGGERGERSTTGASGGRSGEDSPRPSAQEGPRRGQDVQRERGPDRAQERPQQGAQDRQPGSDRSGSRRDTTGQDMRRQDSQKDQQKSTRQPRPDSAAERPGERRSTTGQSPESGRTQDDRRGARDERRDRDRMDRTNRGDRMDQQRGREQLDGGPTQQRDDRAGSREQRDDRTGAREQREDRAGTRQERREDRAGSREERSGSARLTEDQRTRISDVITRRRDVPVANVNVDVRVGVTLPRSVRVREVPREIVDIYPEFRGYRYTVVRDEIVIIEPRTHRVVEVVPRSGRATTGTRTSVRESSRISLTDDKRRRIREIVMRERPSARCEDIRVEVGEELPRSISVLDFPDVIVREAPEIREYRFCVHGDDIVLVDPREYRIVEVID